MARSLAQTIPDIVIPSELVDLVDRDPTAGIDVAAICCSRSGIPGFFQGVHLIPVSCYRPVAAPSSIVGPALIAP